MTQEIKDITIILNEFKNQMNYLRSKVDSMDNSYDKRISNLEAVVTPLIA
jgi:hypothetical protein